jgi:hypothetical protein
VQLLSPRYCDVPSADALPRDREMAADVLPEVHVRGFTTLQPA